MFSGRWYMALLTTFRESGTYHLSDVANKENKMTIGLFLISNFSSCALFMLWKINRCWHSIFSLSQDISIIEHSTIQHYKVAVARKYGVCLTGYRSKVYCQNVGVAVIHWLCHRRVALHRIQGCRKNNCSLFLSPLSIPLFFCELFLSSSVGLILKSVEMLYSQVSWLWYDYGHSIYCNAWCGTYYAVD